MLEQRALRSTVFWVVAIFAFTSLIAVAAIAIRVSTILGQGQSTDPYSIGITASVLDLCALAFLASIVATRRQATNRPAAVVLCAFAAAEGTVAAVLSLFLFANVRPASPNDVNVGKPSRLAIADTGIALASVYLASHVALYVYLLWPGRPIARDRDQESPDHSSPSRSAKRSATVVLTPLKPTRPSFARSASEPRSPAISMYSNGARSSIRSSLHQAIRPMTSRTRLLRQSLLSVTESRGRPSSYDAARPHSFENWDTSMVEEELESSYEYMQNDPTSRRLDVIPGSRPVSPAKPLDGPFTQHLTPEETPLPESPCLRSTSIETSSTRDDSQSLPPLRRPSTSQSHIHPLFRPESPLPPPLPSPNTVITASPLAGQVVSPAHAAGWTLHSRELWRPGSVSPASPCNSRAGSVKDLRLQSPSSPLAEMPSSPLSQSAK